MSGRKAALTIGGAASVGIGYYLYQAGGNPKVAEKQAEYDAAKLSRKMKGEMPGSEKEAKTGLKLTAEEAGQKMDRALNEAKATTHKVDAKLENYRANAEKNISEYSQQAKKDVNNALNTFDKTVEQKAAETKGYFSGWFGGK